MKKALTFLLLLLPLSVVQAQDITTLEYSFTGDLVANATTAGCTYETTSATSDYLPDSLVIVEDARGVCGRYLTKTVYGAEDGQLVRLYSYAGKVIPRKVIPEQVVWRRSAGVVSIDNDADDLTQKQVEW